MIERLTSRIKSWTTRFLSFAGRLQLIQSVLFGIQGFWTSILYLPKRVLLKVEQLIRAFLWKGPELSKGGAKVAWEELTNPKNEGGIGLKKLEDWNKACLAKYLWTICLHNPTSNWATWARANLLRGRSIWEIKALANCSWIWRKLLKMRDFFRPHIRYTIGNGQLT